jgi:hypothetical protein
LIRTPLLPSSSLSDCHIAPKLSTRLVVVSEVVRERLDVRRLAGFEIKVAAIDHALPIWLPLLVISLPAMILHARAVGLSQFGDRIACD